MSTFLFDKIIFGPVRSRRLGLSLGVNVMYPGAKLCNFDCVYCECGWNGDNPNGKFNSVADIARQLDLTLDAMAEEGNLPDSITFSGNGEPTMHPEFHKIIANTIDTRNRLAPNAIVSVLSNATMIDRPEVFEALNKVDKNILKLDSGFDNTIRLINQPKNPRPIEEQIELFKKFNGNLIIQTIFLRGEHNGQIIDNTTDEEINAWIKVLQEVQPKEVMMYSLDRDTPENNLIRVRFEEMKIISEKVEALGIKVEVY